MTTELHMREATEADLGYSLAVSTIPAPRHAIGRATHPRPRKIGIIGLGFAERVGA